MNTSATGGILPAGVPLPVDDDALDAIFQGLIAQITGLDGSLVRPRWQLVVPQQPTPSTNWCALGVMDADPDAGPWIAYDPISQQSLYYRHESLTVPVTFYGPNCRAFARQLRDGIAVAQNTETLLPYDIRYVSCGPIRTIPELVNQQWIKRADMTVYFRRKVTRLYAVQTILIADIHVIDDTVINDTIIVPPGSPIVE